MLNGWIILDKPSGITSAHAVAKVKRLVAQWQGGMVVQHPSSLSHSATLSPKTGHAGTLDPLASGILPLALGEATKTVPYMMDTAKSYAFTVTWGEERDTDDSQGIVTRQSEKRPATEEITNILPEFIGKIRQAPPAYSAIKTEGKRAYARARRGEAVALQEREVEVYALDFTASSLALPSQEGSEFLCHCGKGTYVRALARDMGRRLGCFGYISRLRRLSVGRFTENHAISLESLEEMVHKGELGFLLPVESALDDILAQDISPDQAARLKRGQAVLLAEGDGHKLGIPPETVVLARCHGKAVAICSMSLGSMKPVRVFNL